MKTIEITEQSIYQIKNLLIADEVIRKLLYIQAPNAIASTTNVTAAMVTDLISITPYLQDDDGVENSAQSNFIVIYPSYFSFSDDTKHDVSINIDLFVYKDYYLLDGAKFRLTQMMNRILNILENKKLGFAEKFKITDARLTNIDRGKTLGYLTSWTVTNGTAINY
jgi:hypothetical protein